MTENKEVKIALIVGMIMITICLLTFIIYKANQTKPIDTNIRVYKLFEKSNTTEDMSYQDRHEFHECVVSTEDAIKISKEYQKIAKIPESHQVVGVTLMGNYRVELGDTFIAFDGGDNNYIYKSNGQYVIDYKTDLFDYVKQVCS